MKKMFFFLLIIATAVSLTSCYDYHPLEPIYESWLCTVNTDGTDLNYLRPAVGHHLVVTPDSERVIIFSSNHIYSMDIDGSDFITLNDSIDSYLYGGIPSIAETPEGTKIVFSSYTICDILPHEIDLDIYEIDLDSNELTNLTNSPGIHERDPCYSHDGTKIVYQTQADSIITVSIMDYDGENKREVIKYKNPSILYSSFRCPCFQ